MAGFLGYVITGISRILHRLFPNNHANSLNNIEPFVTHKTLHPCDFIQKNLFIVGDVHGCYNEMILLLKNARKKSQKPLVVIFVGDIINKGPKNLEMVNYVQNTPDTFTIRGNHEVKILKQCMALKSGQISSLECKKWVSNLSSTNVDFLLNLPYTISIPFLNIICVHAGLLPGRPLHMQTKNDMVNMRNITWTNDPFHGQLYQGTYKASVGDAWSPFWTGPEHLYFGHDAKRKLQKNKFCTGLDTGCVYGGKLTGVLLHLPSDLNKVDCNLIVKDIIQVKPLSVYKPVNVEM